MRHSEEKRTIWNLNTIQSNTSMHSQWVQWPLASGMQLAKSTGLPQTKQQNNGAGAVCSRSSVIRCRSSGVITLPSVVRKFTRKCHQRLYGSAHTTTGFLGRLSTFWANRGLGQSPLHQGRPITSSGGCQGHPHRPRFSSNGASELPVEAKDSLAFALFRAN